ncbi:hypothetical protein BUY49_09565 [Staphylococcus devriesei]|uniref:hypothetical protein n=1 Tax=Staphylococcus devriesei TaxID=586733 RepID=UPI000E69C0D8|nr:hypothetical protein [Staphylococcus devriesei]RIL70636.1 hypothetical protein BUY49_09565 [Staphylococcus devriesei]
MSKVKFKKIQGESIETLENKINDYLESEEGSHFEILNISIEKVEERKFPNNEEVLSALLILTHKN